MRDYSKVLLSDALPAALHMCRKALCLPAVAVSLPEISAAYRRNSGVTYTADISNISAEYCCRNDLRHLFYLDPYRRP